MKGSSRIENLPESATLALSKKVRELKAQGRDIVGLTLGEPNFNTPDHIKKAAIQAIHDNFSQYPPVAGIPELRSAICDKFKTQNNISWQPENIVISTGAKQSLFNVIMSLVNPSEEVILIAPYWVSYEPMVYMAQGKARIIATDISSGFKASPQQLENSITDNSKLLILNSPSNPTGVMYTEGELRELAAVIERHPHLLVVSDEIYEHIHYGEAPFSIGSLPNIAERVITVNGLSKGFAMTGWRLGYLGATKWIADLCENIQGQVTSGASSITQKAAVAAISGDLSPTFKMRDEFKKRRDVLFKRLSGIKGIQTRLPEGAFYFYPDVSAYFGLTTPSGVHIKDILSLTDAMLEEGGVSLVPGSAFGTSEHFRISYAYSVEEIEVAMDRMETFLNSLK